MRRPWFKVWQQGQALDPPVAMDELPRRARVAGHVATRNGRDGALSEVYVLAADAEQAQRLFEEGQGSLLAEA